MKGMGKTKEYLTLKTEEYAPQKGRYLPKSPHKTKDTEYHLSDRMQLSEPDTFRMLV